MKITMIGLGKMGSNMTKRILRAGHECVVYDRASDKREALRKAGAVPIEHLSEIADLASNPHEPRVVWMMLPAGNTTESTVQRLAEILTAGDILIDGGNSYYKDDIRHADELQAKGIRYLDVGTSGGVWGLERGYCLMIGGDPTAAEYVTPIFRALAPGSKGIPETEGRTRGKSTADEGFLYCGPAGSGHFVKMLHNGIEYAMMQAYAEGFEILKKSQYHLELGEISEVWRRGSVIGSWLLDLIALSLNRDVELSDFEGVVQDSGEGRWTLQAAVEEAVPAHVIAAALFVRFRSRETHSYGEKLLSAMRSGFGGHIEPKQEKAS
jgi:6-phosphogluconate dehydrogenase